MKNRSSSPTSFSLRIGVVAFFLAACAPGGCCGSAEIANYQEAERIALAQELDALEFHKPLAEVWPAILAVLEEHGFSLGEGAAVPVEGRTLESAFKNAPTGAHRMLVHVIRVDGSRWRLSIDKQVHTQAGDGGSSASIVDRYYDPEASQILWAIFLRTEPARAGEIQQRVRERAERAGAAGRGYDRGCAACAGLIPPPPQ